MRSDRLSYIIGAVFLAVTAYTLFEQAALKPLMGMLIYSAVVFVLVLFGITSLIFGYSLRPKKQKLLSMTPSSTIESRMKLTQIKGIAEKRAEQLEALGIATVADLSAASAEQLAKELQVSSKIINRWIRDARNLLLEK